MRESNSFESCGTYSRYMAALASAPLPTFSSHMCPPIAIGVGTIGRLNSRASQTISVRVTPAVAESHLLNVRSVVARVLGL